MQRRTEYEKRWCRSERIGPTIVITILYSIVLWRWRRRRRRGAAASADTTSLHKHLEAFKCCRHATQGPCLSRSQSCMINVLQVYCHTSAYHIPIANRTLQQWRPQLGDFHVPDTADFYSNGSEIWGDPNQGGQVRDMQRSEGDEKHIRFQSENLKGKERIGKPRRRWEDKS